MKFLKLLTVYALVTICHLSAAFANTAIFSGGCFWCMQPPYDALIGKGVISVRVGYSGGTKDNPTYEDVSSGGTGHREVIEINYDPKKISYQSLLTIFWKNIDPYDQKGQFCDKGEQYTSAVYYNNPQEMADYQLTKPKNNLATVLLPAMKFYPAEEYHQSYYKKNPIRYKLYRFNCGRDKRLKEVWGQSPH